MHRINPRAVLLQISGFGATSSQADAPGFGKMGEARSGVVHLTGFPDGPPVHTGFSHGDAVTGLMGAYASSPHCTAATTTPDSTASGSTSLSSSPCSVWSSGRSSSTTSWDAYPNAPATSSPSPPRP